MFGYKQKIRGGGEVFAAILFVLGLFFLLTPARAEATPLGGGSLPCDSGTVLWSVDSDGTLSLTGTGVVSPSVAGSISDMTNIPWHQYRTSITTIHMDHSVQPTSMNRWFSTLTSLISANAQDWDTSLVTDFAGLFQYDSALITLDVSHFVTSNATDISHMFQGCKVLTALDVSHFIHPNSRICTRYFRTAMFW